MSQILELRVNYPHHLSAAPVLSPNGIYTPSGGEEFERFELPVPGFTSDWRINEVREFVDQYPALRGFDVARREDDGPLESHNPE